MAVQNPRDSSPNKPRDELPPSAMGLREAAERLGVHYMTAYRYIRTGRLAAEKVGTEWRVDSDDVDRLRSAGATPVQRPSRRTGAKNRLEERLIAGDELGAWNVVEATLASGAEPADIHLELLAPALRSIGDRWEGGELVIGDEHRASVVAQRLIGRLGTRFTRRGRKRAMVIVGAVAGERHDIPVAIVADQLRAAGFEVVNFGADTPADSFAAAASQHRTLAVVLGATGSGHERAVMAAIAAVRGAATVPVLVGGAAVHNAKEATSLGADGWTGPDARTVVATIEALLER